MVGYDFIDVKLDMTPFMAIATELNKRDKNFQLDKYDCKQIYLKSVEEHQKKTSMASSPCELDSVQKDNLVEYVCECFMATPYRYNVVTPLEWLKPLGVHKIGDSTAISEGRRLVFSLFPDNYESYVEINVLMQGYLSYNSERIFLKNVMRTLSVLIFMLKQNNILYNSGAYKSTPSAYDTLSGKHKRFLSIKGQATCEKFNFFDGCISFPVSTSKYLNELSLTRDFSLLQVESAKGIVNASLCASAELLDNESNEALRVKSAIDWLIQSEINEDETMSFIQICMGLESIFGDNDSDGGLTNSLADRCAYLIGRNITERKEIKDEFKRMYKVRSKIIHGVKSHLTQNEEDIKYRAFHYLKKSISREIRNLREIPERKS